MADPFTYPQNQQSYDNFPGGMPPKPPATDNQNMSYPAMPPPPKSNGSVPGVGTGSMVNGLDGASRPSFPGFPTKPGMPTRPDGQSMPYVGQNTNIGQMSGLPPRPKFTQVPNSQAPTRPDFPPMPNQPPRSGMPTAMPPRPAFASGMPPMPSRPAMPPSSANANYQLPSKQLAQSSSPSLVDGQNGLSVSGSPQFGLPSANISQPAPSMHPASSGGASTASSVQGSEPPSARSSRGPSPLPGTQYDAMEGQFTPSHTPLPGQTPGANPPFPGPNPSFPSTQPSQTSVSQSFPGVSFPGQQPASSIGQQQVTPPKQEATPLLPGQQSHTPPFGGQQPQNSQYGSQQQQTSTFGVSQNQTTPPFTGRAATSQYGKHAPPYTGQATSQVANPPYQRYTPPSVNQQSRIPSMPAQPPIPGMPPMPGQPPMPTMVPGQPPIPTMSGQPPMSTMPGQPPMPTMMPGQPPMPTMVPGQPPMPTMMPGQVIPPMPSQPPILGQQGSDAARPSGRRQYPKMAPGYNQQATAPGGAQGMGQGAPWNQNQGQGAPSNQTWSSDQSQSTTSLQNQTYSSQPYNAQNFPGGAPQTGVPSSYPGAPQPGAPPSYPGGPQPGASPSYPGGPQPGAPPSYAAPAQGYGTQQSGRVGASGGYPAPTSGSNSSGTMGNNGTPGTGMLHDFGRMNVQNYTINLLQDKNLIPPQGLEMPLPNLSNGYKKMNVSPDIFCSTLNAIPKDQSLLNKARLPLGILIHPFKDLSHLPVIQSSVIVRCKSCRTYINPFVSFADKRRWKCNLCLRMNDAPDEFQFDPISKSYGDPLRRPEMKSSTIEFIAPSEYMLRPPQPSVYLFVLDVSFNAVETGYLDIFCRTLTKNLEKLPGDSRTNIAFITYDSCVHFYNLADVLSQPQMMVVSDLEDIFLPSPDNLLVNLNENRDMVLDLLSNLPGQFTGTGDTGNALGAALQAAHKLMSSTGGRITVVNTCLPNIGPGALKERESTQKDSKNAPLGPATDFYKKLALDCSGQQIAVDIFSLNSQYTDLATLSCASKYSGGTVQYYPAFHTAHNRGQSDRFEIDFKRYLTRKIGLEAVMRIRCTRGLSINTFHGNFFVRSTDLLSLPNINPDASFAMQMSIEDPLNDLNTACFQAALLYTSSKGERRIRVHTLCLPVTNQLNEVINSANQQAIVGLLAKMAVDRSINSSVRDSREAMINAATDAICAYAGTLPQAHRIGTVPVPSNLKCLPLYVMALLKSTPFSPAQGTKLDERVHAMDECKSLPLNFMIQRIHPNLYPLHNLDRETSILGQGESHIPQPPLLQLSSANMDRHGVYLLDTATRIYLWLGAAISDKYCQDVFDKPNFMALPDMQVSLPALENPTSEALRSFINYLLDQRPFHADIVILREDSRMRMDFLRYMIEDRTESTMSYYEFIQHIQKNMKS